MEWYAFYPEDTLLCKGAEPMDMGADHHASQIFPPPAQTIAGALRTAVLVQNGISYKEYYEESVDPGVLESIGRPGDEAPFQVVGPLFQNARQIFVPVPFSWFVDKSVTMDSEVTVFKACSVNSLLIKMEGENLLWARGESEEMASLGGRWVALQDLFSNTGKAQVYAPDYFFAAEPRTGIALNQNRSVREGHLYTFTHIRMKPEIALVFGVSGSLPLAAEGLLQLGAERRIGRYEKIEDPMRTEGSSGIFMSLSLVKGASDANRSILATGRIQYIGGWDMKRGFHKPMSGFFPAGSVFSEKLNASFIQI